MIKDTVAPIPIDLLKEYFSDDSIVFNIDYAESILKGDKLITYLSNLDIPCQLTGWDKVSKADKFDFIKDYMNAKLVVNSTELEVCILRILFEASYLDFIERYSCENILSEKEVIEFCNENKDLIDKWLTILASGSVFALATVPDLLESVKEEYETVDDYDYCGVNFAQLFKHEATQDLLTADRDVFYFDKQFNEPMFKGKNLYSYWSHEANTMAVLTWAISSGETTHEEFYAAIEKGMEDVSALR